MIHLIALSPVLSIIISSVYVQFTPLIHINHHHIRLDVPPSFTTAPIHTSHHYLLNNHLHSNHFPHDSGLLKVLNLLIE